MNQEEICLINWHSQQTDILLNPRMPEVDQMSVRQALNGSDLQGHIWLTSSGSSGRLKCAALSKEAILASAAAVNRHLQSNASDVWFNPLPHFHVGGLGIWARSFLNDAKVVCGWSAAARWNAWEFVNGVSSANATLTSLVPAHVHDLISQQLAAPFSLRAIIVGGGAISEKLYLDAVRLGWKLLPSYGLTECASQVATASLESLKQLSYPLLTVLDHVQLACDDQGRLKIKSPSLLTALAERDNASGEWLISDPKHEGWLTTQDFAILENGGVKTVCREGEFIKIGGESVDLVRLDGILDEVLMQAKWMGDAAIVAFPDERLGHVVHLAVAAKRNSSCNFHTIIDSFNQKVLPFESIRQVHFIDDIPRSPLNKLLRKYLLNLL